MTEAQYLSPMEAARRLGVSADRVRQLADAGRLPSRRTPLGRLFLAEDVERLRLERADSSPVPAA
jgi:excisionase family DNA binding protein